MTNHICANIFSVTYRQVAILQLLILVCLLAFLQTTGHTASLTVHGRILWVSDGDTVALLDANHTLHKIRLAGIDAPETAMPYGRQATLHLMSLVLDKNVTAVGYKRDRYGRIVATLMLGAQDVNLAMIQTGLAWHYKRYANEQPTAQSQTYAQAEERARAKNLALWRDADPSAPWDWRKSRKNRSTQNVEVIFPAKLAMYTGNNS